MCDNLDGTFLLVSVSPVAAAGGRTGNKNNPRTNLPFDFGGMHRCIERSFMPGTAANERTNEGTNPMTGRVLSGEWWRPISKQSTPVISAHGADLRRPSMPTISHLVRDPVLSAPATF